MALSIEIQAFEEHGIHIVPPTRADFDELARPLIGRVADIGLRLKPLLAIVSNESEHTVVSYSKVWTAWYSDGRSTHIRSHTSFPETICGDLSIARDPDALPPGAQRVETANLVIQGYAQTEPYYDQFLDQFIVEKDRMLAHAETLTIAVEAVIFIDGTLVGIDRDGWLTDLFSECVAQKQAWYREILDRLDAGATVEEAYAPIQAFQEQRRVYMRTRPRSGPRELLLWKTQAAADAQRWRRKVTDEALAQRLRSSIRLEPFKIHRESNTAE
jgi:hypothetical protein